MENVSAIPTSATLDIVRVFAMTGVVSDHYMQAKGGEVWDNIGLWLGAVCVSIFFSLSAFLFGKKWRKDNYNQFQPSTYFRKRFSRIYIPLWITVLIIVFIESFLEKGFGIDTVLFNILGLGWFRPFQTGGHLWYITMLLGLYLLFFALSFLKTNKLDRTPRNVIGGGVTC